MAGRDLDPGPWIGRLEALGDCVLVVGDAATLKVHIHTDIPGGATALFAGLGEVSHLDAPENVAAVDAALERLRTGAVAPAARDDGEGRFVVGEAVGFVDDAIFAWGETGPTLAAVLGQLGSDAELLTCIAGADAPLDEAGVRALGPDGVELECEDGGQLACWWLVAAE